MGTVKRKTKNKIRRFIFDSVSFSLMCFGAYKMIEFGVLLSKIGVLALDFFPIFWFIIIKYIIKIKKAIRKLIALN